MTGDLLDLKGRNALITGAGQNVGREIALLLAAHGAGTVVVNDLFVDRAEAVVADIEAAGGTGLAVAADVTDPASVDAMVEVTRRIDGPLQIVVNNAGLPPGMFSLGPFAESSRESWEPVIRLNLYGVMYVTHAFLKPIVNSGWGRVITIVSDAGRAGDPYQAAYAAAKAGAAGLMRSIASEVGKFGVTVNSVALASITRDDSSQPMSEEDAPRYRRYALRRPGVPKDVAPMVLFLASDAASWITGQVYPVNGGYTYSL
jgi:3-oxoacyl-[acyl-carrier protein] reductase